MSDPIISVVIPSHNRARLLPRAIESVLRQTGAEIDAPGAVEAIVVDDASTDDTPQVVSRYAVACVRNSVNRERGASRNIGAAMARGRWLAFLDSDDEWEDGKLVAQLSVVADREVCLTGCWVIDGQGGLLGTKLPPESRSNASMDLGNPYPAVPSSMLIARHTFDRLGGFPEERNVQGSEDWIFMAKLARAGYVPVQVREPLVRYRVHSGNSTANPTTALSSSLAAVEWLSRNGIVAPSQARKARARQYDSAARGYALRGQRLSALRCMRKAARSTDRRDLVALFSATAAAAVRAGFRRGVSGWPVEAQAG